MEQQTVQISREALMDALSENVVKVKFVKKDGSERVMKCTRSMELIPAELSDGKDRALKDINVIPVYDLEASGWRSFDFTRLLDVEIDPED